MRYLLRLLLFTSFLIFFYTSNTFAAINFYFTPLKYELTLATGSTITRTATLTNNSDKTVTIITGKSDFQTNGTSGTPSFVRKSELVFQDQELSSWITIDTPTFDIAPSESYTINFTIDVPTNAAPGGHYGAVFFKNDNSENSTTGHVGINVDYGVLILVQVQGDIIIEGGMSGSGIVVSGGSDSSKGGYSDRPEGDKLISGGGPTGDPGWFGILASGATYDDCPFGDFTSSNIDGKCFDNPFAESEEPEEGSQDTVEVDTEGNIVISDNPNNVSGSDSNTLSDNIVPLGKDEDFEITFEIPFENTGTVHIKPTGRIILEDSEGNQIKGVGKKSVINKHGAIVREEIVDYIPINDTEGNVLPSSTRIFEGEWKGFPYKGYSPEGEIVIKYWNPSEYYTRKNKEEAGFLMFWERVCEAKRHEKITAIIDVTYTDINGEEIEFSSAKEFYIDYTEEYVGINPYIAIPFTLLVLLTLLYIFGKVFFFIGGKKKKRCKHCKVVVRKNWHVCPKCKKKIK